MRAFAFIAVLLVAIPAAAQAPDLGLPPLGAPPAIDDVLDTAREATDMASQDLWTVRAAALRALRRAHPDLIDVDRHGDAVVRGEVLALSPAPASLERARAAEFDIIGREAMAGLDLEIVTLRAPAGMSTRDALRRLQRADPIGAYDFNHLYSGAGAARGKPLSLRAAPAARAAARPRIGLIDGGVDARHPVFAGVSLQQRSFVAAAAMASAHGTEVASLIVGESGGFHAAAPGAQLYVADVYGDTPTGGSAAAIAAAFAWLAAARVSVINTSLVGPPNAALEATVRAMIAHGFVIVAAVGNDGPAAAPLYPASYPGVIGVTGVDSRDRALMEAARGRQVDIAAPGADMAAATLGGGYARVRGTSFAAPIVTGLIARAAPISSAQAQIMLNAAAVDLGARGVDTTYGAGLVGRTLRMDPRVLVVRN